MGAHGGRRCDNAVTRGWLKAVGVLALVALVSAVPMMTDDRYLLKVLVFVGINVIVVAGLALLFGFAGQVSLGHAGFVGIGAYTSAHLTAALGLPWIVGVLAATTVAALGGLGLAIPSLRLRGHYLAMATLGFNEIMYVVFREARALTGGNDGLSGIPFPEFAGVEIDSPAGIYLLVWGIAIVVVVLVANILRGRPGRAMRGLHGSEIGVLACGVDIARLKIQTFALSAGLAGLAGALYAHAVGFIAPSTFSLEHSVILLAIVVVGGIGSLAGPLTAAVALTLLPYADSLIPGLGKEAVAFMQEWEADIYGIAMIMVVIMAPKGIGGLIRAGRARVWARETA